MDRPPFGQCLTLVASADASWRQLTATLALDGVDVWGWSGRLLLDVVAELQRRAAAADGGSDAAAAGLAAARVEQATAADGGAAWGSLTAEEAARILEQG